MAFFIAVIAPIQGSKSYLVCGLNQSGFWINKNRETTIRGLFAAGDAAGGVPFEFVSGCWVEGAIAVESAVEYLKRNREKVLYEVYSSIQDEKYRVYAPLRRNNGIKPEALLPACIR